MENVETCWEPEIHQHCPGSPCILIGLKSDLRDEFAINADDLSSKGFSPISKKTGEEMAKKIGAKSYLECSALKQINIRDVFETACRIVLHPDFGEKQEEIQVENKYCCQIM